MKSLRMAVSALVLSLVACGSAAETPEALAEEQADVMNDFAAVVEDIETTEDVEAAKPKLRELADELKAAHTKWKALLADGVSQEDIDMAMKDSQALVAAGDRITAAFTELATNPSLMTSIPALMKEFEDVYSSK